MGSQGQTLQDESGRIRQDADGRMMLLNADGLCPTCCDGELGPCCEAGERCEVVPAPTDCTMKVWFEASADAPTLVAATPDTPGATTTISGSASDTSSALDKYTNFDSTLIDPPSDCVLGSALALTTSATDSSPSVASPITSGSIVGNVTLTRNIFETPTPDPSLYIGDTPDTTDFWGFQFTVTFSGTGTGVSAAAVAQGYVFWEDNAFTTHITDSQMDGTITPTLLYEGDCPVGVRVDFEITQTQLFGSFPFTEADATITGSIAVAFCDCIDGCSGAGDVCASSGVPTAARGTGSGRLFTREPSHD